jgi:Sulfotransferase family
VRDADPNAMPPPIAFVGGTGRSGTHVVARLLGHHSQYAYVPVEARFHVNPQGFPDLLAGSVSPEVFVRRLRGFWWKRIPGGQPLPAVLPRFALGRQVRGLHKVMSRRRMDRAVVRFKRAWPRDPETACRRLFLDLLWPVATRAGKPGLVEMSTFAVAQAPTLVRLFPEARLVHILRDGRDSGSSKVSRPQRPEHPRDPWEGLRWWAERLETAERGVAAVPEGKVLMLSLEELAYGDRERAYRALLAFLGIGDEPAIREFFDREVNEENATRGRWRRGLSKSEQRDLTTQYERTLDEIESRGYTAGPVLRDTYRRLG